MNVSCDCRCCLMIYRDGLRAKMKPFIRHYDLSLPGLRIDAQER